MPATPDDLKWAAETIAAMQATCPHDVGRASNEQKFQGKWIKVVQCPKCGLFDPPETGGGLRQS